MLVNKINSNIGFMANANNGEKYSRKNCTTTMLMLGTVGAEMLVTPLIADKINFKNPFTKQVAHSLEKNAIAGIGILALGFVAAQLFNLYDKKNPDNKFGNFCYNFLNKPYKKVQ